MTQWLFALLLMPVHCVMAWGYWWWLRSRSAAYRWHLPALIAALAAGVVAGRIAFSTQPVSPSPIWPHVAAATASFLTFGGILLLLLWAEVRRQRQSPK